MLVQAQYHFYFDFEIPRLDKPLKVAISHPSFNAHVQGWDQQEPLFYGEIGRTLENLHVVIQSADALQVLVSRSVKSLCVDRLRVLLEWESESPPNESMVAESRDRAVSVGNSILEHLRVVAQAPLARRIGRYWKPGNSVFALLVPHTETWLNLDDGSPLPVFNEGNSKCSSGAILAPETGRGRAQDLWTSLSGGPRPPLSSSLLVDAQSALMSLNIREAILSIASACEVHASQYLKEQSVLSNSQASAAMSGGGSFANKYFHELPQATCSRSLRDDYGSVFVDIDAVYGQRNGLMHGGSLRGDFAALDEIQQHHEVLRWVGSARKAIGWLDTLPR
ncbi:hypothetical protein FXF53_18415 [Micromonospora sp. WP24]|uniref:hypothetical protein n=1 Tax=Micromonospora sp. WP24 TaxID=2604469 RepID=UPI0011DC2468|nr:hypothetical protein [Micromonospora sp. WP24]TYB98100.1 hypothetical protein FXF53_18415 [Micromonospora sp. WP24]